MNTINIENKEYVVLPRKEYEDLRTKSAVKAVGAKKAIPCRWQEVGPQTH